MRPGRKADKYVLAQAKDEGGNVADKIGHEANKAADATKKQVDKLSGPIDKVSCMLLPWMSTNSSAHHLSTTAHYGEPAPVCCLRSHPLVQPAGRGSIAKLQTPVRS